VDPLTWPLWLKLLVGWGPLGIWAAWAEWRARGTERAHHATRDSHEEAAKEVAAEHQRQLTDLTDRFVKLVERQSAKAHELVEKVEEKKRRTNGEDKTTP